MLILVKCFLDNKRTGRNNPCRHNRKELSL